MGLFSFTGSQKKDMNAAPKKSVKPAAAPAPAPKAARGDAEVSVEKKAGAPVMTVAGAKAERAARVLVAPRITEKASMLANANVYTFEVAPRATKKDIAQAVKDLYKVSPKAVAIVRTQGKSVRLRSRRGFGKKTDVKKAYVYLKAGDKIEFA
jgi:large subunit ribosomal protein L23